MTGWQFDPGALEVDPAATDGVYVAFKDGNRFTRWLRIADSDTVTVTVDEVAGTVTFTGAAPEEDPIITVTGGVPSYVFDADGSLVTTEVP